MKGYGGVEVAIHSFSTLAIDGMSVQIQDTASLPAEGKTPGA
jgi:hypothetical protein